MPILIWPLRTFLAAALFGGNAFDSSGNVGQLNDLWRYQPPNTGPDFAIAIAPASLLVASGQSGTTTITVTDKNGFNSAVSFACSGLPAGAACSFTLQPVPTQAGLSYWTLNVTTASTTAALPPNGRPLIPGAALAVGLCCLCWKKRLRLQMILLLAVSAAGLGLLAGCGGGSSPVHQSVTSTVTVTATSGSLQHSTTFSLTVN